VELKRLKEIVAQPVHGINDVVEITSENFLSNSKHNKEIKLMLGAIMEKLELISQRVAALESKQSSIFQIEVDEEDLEHTPTFEEELEKFED
jgi:hypothetical protein